MHGPSRQTRVRCGAADLYGFFINPALTYLHSELSQTRKEIEDAPSNPKYLLTDACVGYRFCEAH
jgi:hypothetical protein